MANPPKRTETVRVVDVALAAGTTPEKIIEILWSLGLVVSGPDATLDLEQATAARTLAIDARKATVRPPMHGGPTAPTDEPLPAAEVRSNGKPIDVPKVLEGRSARLFEIAAAVSVPVDDLVARLPSIGFKRPADHLTVLDTATVARLIATFYVTPSDGFVVSDVSEAVKRRRKFRT